MRGFPVQYPNCLNCGKELPSYSGKGQPRKYCGNYKCPIEYREKKSIAEHGVSSMTAYKIRKKNDPSICSVCFQMKTRHKPWCIESRRKVEIKRKEDCDKLRKQMIEAYDSKCECCGESRPEFLTIDHTFGKTAKEKKSRNTGWQMYRDLRRRGFPRDGYRLLCYNCNCSRGHRGYCPHERENSGQLLLQMVPGA